MAGPAQVAGGVFIPFKASTAAFVKRVGAAGAAMTAFGSKVGVSSAALKKMGGALVAFGGAAAALKVVGGAVSSFRQFEVAMTRVKAVSQASSEQMKQLTEATQRTAATTTFTAKEIAEGFGFMAMAGMRTEQMLGSVEHAANLAMAAQMGMGQASDIVTNIMKAMGVETRDLADAVDKLVNVQSRANVTVQMVGEGMRYVGPLAKSAGVSLSDVVAAMGNLGNAGIQASMAGTTLRQAIQNMMNPAKQARKAMERLGLSFTTSDGKLKDFVTIIDMLEKKMLSTKDILKLFGVRSGPGMAALIGQGAASLKLLREEVDKVGASQRQALAVMGTYDGKVNQLNASVEALQIDLGKRLTPALGDVVMGTKNAFDWFNKLDDVTKNVSYTVGGLTTSVVAVAGTAFGIAALGVNFAALGAAIGTAAVAAAPFVAIAASLVAAYTFINASMGEQKIQEDYVNNMNVAVGTSKNYNKILKELKSTGLDPTTKRTKELLVVAKQYNVAIPKSVVSNERFAKVLKETGHGALFAAKAIKSFNMQLGDDKAEKKKLTTLEKYQDVIAKVTKLTGLFVDGEIESSKALSSVDKRMSDVRLTMTEYQMQMESMGETADAFESVELVVKNLQEQLLKLTQEKYQIQLDILTNRGGGTGDLTSSGSGTSGGQISVSAPYIPKAAKMGASSSPSTQEFWDAKKDELSVTVDATTAVEGFSDVLQGSIPPIGALVGSAFGPIGVAVGNLVDMLLKSVPSFGKFSGLMLKLAVALASILEPIIASLLPLLSLVVQVLVQLAPTLAYLVDAIMSFTTTITNQIAAPFIAALSGLTAALLGAVIGIEGLLDEVGIGILSNAERDKMIRDQEDALRLMEDTWDIINPTDPSMWQDRQTADLGEWTELNFDFDSLSNSVNGTTDAMDDLTDEILNAPSGFKLAGYAYGAASGQMPSDSATGGGGSTNIFINELNDYQTIKGLIDSDTRRRSYSSGSQFPVPA